MPTPKITVHTVKCTRTHRNLVPSWIIQVPFFPCMSEIIFKTANCQIFSERKFHRGRLLVFIGHSCIVLCTKRKRNHIESTCSCNAFFLRTSMIPVIVHLPSTGSLPVAARAAPAWLGTSVLLFAIFGAVLGLLGVVILILILYIYKQ